MIVMRDILPTGSVRYENDPKWGGAGNWPDAPVRCAVVISVLFLLGGALTAEQALATPFEHGWWLSAYLVLVGFVAQILLVVGRTPLLARPPRASRQWVEIALWNLGAVGVPLGVFNDAPWTVLTASSAMLGALALYAAGLRRSPARKGRIRLAYYALVAFLALSVLVGTALAEALPGQ
jgi:hypothetical protein